VVDRVRADGLKSTAGFVRRRLNEWGPLGYSAAGTVVELGAGVTGLGPGDNVAIAGGGHANHAEIDIVPHLLCARVPPGVSHEDAAFATVGAIAMQGFRRSGADVGSSVAVIGLGLIGQLTMRIASAAGCNAIGIDLERDLVELARGDGRRAVLREEVGGELDESADAVIVCASGGGADPIELAAKLARDRGVVVVVGAVPMDVPRAPFYDKELDLRLSRSYGPGRYDPEYEIHGHDYPIGYVRWTEQRNMEAFLDLVARGLVKPAELVSHRFDVADVEEAYEILSSGHPVAIILGYGRERPIKPAAQARTAAAGRARGLRMGVIGAGSFATGTLIPGTLKAGLEPVAIATASGLSAESARRQFEFERSSADVTEILDDETLDVVVIATQHDSHAELATEALRRGTAVYVEKPLALSFEDLERVREAQAASGAPLFVGFNRRYAPLAVEMRKLTGPCLMTFRVNAGQIEPGHWIHDPERGGGRLIGEGCHFLDFMIQQADADPVSVASRGFPSSPGQPRASVDNFTVRIGFADGGIGTLIYAANAPRGPGKERFEVSSHGSYGEIDDFKRGAIWRGSSKRSLGGRRQDKGFVNQFELLSSVLRGEAEPPSTHGLLLSSLVTLLAARSLETGRDEPVFESGLNAEPARQT
jgi:predicted dehydrogenase/threonine dehydrogenase-like Zn-dependent dehydrogenase